MGLSYDLISEFVKITNDKKENTKEGTVYATVVSGTGGKYVRIDGSDLLTPMDTTTDIEDGERVTLMIKDHKAIVTGNVTTPSASTSKVDKVTESVNSVSDRVGTFELVVADKVSTNELEAYKATIEVLIANKATIEDLTATNAKIENLEVKNAEIENLVAEKATIEDLEAVNATIENLKVKDAEIENAVVENLKATTADIKILNADFAQIKTLVNGNLTSDNILSFNLTSEKVTVDDAFIKDAMIDTISAGKINAGKINTNSVSIGSEDGGMLITGSTQQFTDKNGNVRIQIGKDASGDFTFILYGEDGQGQIINQNGITASAISDGLIVNDMVSDHAALSGGKLDISSVITEINGDNSTTINSSKIYLNDQAQSLEVAFNSLKTQVDTIQEVTIKGDLTAIVEQVQSNTSKIEANKNSINTLISEDTVIKKQVTDLQGTLSETETTLNSKYTTLSQNLDGFKTTVADTYATKKSVTDVVDNIETNYSTTSVMNSAIEQKAQEISASVSSTYATKNEVSTLDNNLRTNYSTTQQMESAINVAKQEINLGVSSIYETKENTTSKIQNAVNNIQVGGTNLWVLLDLKTGYEQNGNINSSSAPHKTRQTIIPTNGARQITYQCWNPNKVTNNSNTNRIAFFDSSKAYISSTQVLVLNGQTYQWQIINIPENTAYVRLGAICGPADVYDTTIKIKFELGNKPTDYSLAPDDVTNDISTAKTEAISSANNTLTTTISNYYTKSQTDSQINIAKEAINLGVSTTYETKENVLTKVTSTLDSAKSYADTKKSEAISTAASDATSKANTAKQEAIKSADKTLTSTIANYYTKTQTDSQINIAKEAINLGVSNTYETKANVTSKINNIQIGGTNLWVLSDITTGWEQNGNITGDKVNHKTRRTLIPTNGAKELVYQCWNPNKVSNSSNSNRVAFFDSSKTWISSNVIDRLNGQAYQKQLMGIPENAAYMRLGAVCGPENSYDDTIKIKFELGNKPTDYSLAPEDVKSDISNAKSEAISTAASDATSKANTAKNDAISSANNTLNTTIANYYTKEQTDSQIKIAKDAIDLSVSKTYETKTNVTSKVDSTLKSAKSYADTKKSEAISTAASDATTKANNAKSQAISAAADDATSKVNKINVGSVNRLIGTSEPYAMAINNTSNYTTWDPYSTPDKQTLKQLGFKVGDQITLSFNWKISKNGSNNYVYGNFRTEFVGYTSDGGKEYKGVIQNPVATFSSSNTSGRSETTVTLTETNLAAWGLRIRIDNSVLTLTISDVKMEKGNKATSWSPAPEDVESDITSIQSETKSLKSTVSSLQLGTDSISASVKSLEETMNNTTNGLASDISRIQDQVNLKMTSDDVKLEIQKEMSKGTNKVTTSTGFTFNQNGLNISKTDSEMKTQITEDGMKIYKNSEVMLTANNQGVDAKNLHATTYLIIGNNSRMEDFTENGSKRTAVFWIG